MERLVVTLEQQNRNPKFKKSQKPKAKLNTEDFQKLMCLLSQGNLNKVDMLGVSSKEHKVSFATVYAGRE